MARLAWTKDNGVTMPATALPAVAVIDSLAEAAVVLSLLQAHGIHAVATPLNFAALNWDKVVAVGGIGIHVARPDVEDAIALLGDPRQALDPAPPFSPRPLLNVAIAVALYCIAGVPPPARIRAAYGEVQSLNW